MFKDMLEEIFDESVQAKNERITASQLIKIAKAKTVKGAMHWFRNSDFTDVQRVAIDRALTLAKTREDLEIILDPATGNTSNLDELLIWRYIFEQVLRKSDELEIRSRYGDPV